MKHKNLTAAKIFWWSQKFCNLQTWITKRNKTLCACFVFLQDSVCNAVVSIPTPTEDATCERPGSANTWHGTLKPWFHFCNNSTNGWARPRLNFRFPYLAHSLFQWICAALMVQCNVRKCRFLYFNTTTDSATAVTISTQVSKKKSMSWSE